MKNGHGIVLLLFGLALCFPVSGFSQPVEMVSIPKGCFMMGSENWGDDEKPVHEVCLDEFYMDKYEVTQKDFKREMKTNPSKFKGPNLPVDSATYSDATGYCDTAGKRLPTEAEWEYAARAGTTTEYYWGNRFIGTYGWVNGNSRGTTHPVGLKKPNKWGLHDMSGNVWEWVLDYYKGKYYSISPKNNPEGPIKGGSMVLRGGSWNVKPSGARSANRSLTRPGSQGDIIGFRCVQ